MRSKQEENLIKTLLSQLPLETLKEEINQREGIITNMPKKMSSSEKYKENIKSLLRLKMYKIN